MHGVAIVLLMFIFSWSAIGNFQNGYSIAPYSSGYGHGCSDAKLAGKPYLNANPTHTQAFMNGYNAGFSACRPNSGNWSVTCKAIEWGLLHPCATYVNPGGSLTFEGKRAKDCISSGGFLSMAGLVSSLPPGVIIAVLEPASKLPIYDCDNIVNWQVIKTASNAAGFLKILGIG